MLSPGLAAEARTKSVLIVANPTSGGYRPADLAELVKILSASGYDTRLHLTTHAGEIEEIAGDRNLAIDVLAIAGGDGSVNEALTGFQNNPAPPALAIIPCGTANVLAHELGLPRRPAETARMILGQRTSPLSFGLANGHPFVLMASAGFDAEVVHGISLALKRKLGKLAYVLTALKIGLTRKSSDLAVEIDDVTYHGKLAVATNGRFYGGPFVVSPDASVIAPGLHVLILEKDDPLSTLRFGLALVLGRVHRSGGVKVLPATSLSITSGRPVAAQIDGDPFGTAPLEVSAARETVAIVVP